MKKFLSKVLTLALICAIVVSGTSITSEAKGKKSSNTVTAAYSSNAVINDFVATLVKSSGVIIGGKSYNPQQINDMLIKHDPIVKSSTLYDEEYDEALNIYYWGLYLDVPASLYYPADYLTGDYADFSNLNERGEGSYTIYFRPEADTPESIYWIKANSEVPLLGQGGENARITGITGNYFTDYFAAKNVNAYYISSWMQTRGLKNATDVYNYLVANGATFVQSNTYTNDGDAVDESGNHYVSDTSTTVTYVCQQCPELTFSDHNYVSYRDNYQTHEVSLSYTKESINKSGALLGMVGYDISTQDMSNTNLTGVTMYGSSVSNY